MGRRLGLLSWSELTLENYEALERLADHFGGPSNFLRACDYVRGVLSSLDRQRQEQKAEPLYGKARNEFVERCVQDLLTGKSPKSKTASARISTEHELSGESAVPPSHRAVRGPVSTENEPSQKKN